MLATAAAGASGPLSRWVVKLAGAGPGPVGLLTELVAARAAEAMGVPTPKARPIWLPVDFPWQVGSDEYDEMVQRSFGWALGLRFVEGARIARAEEVRAAPPPFPARLRALDAFLCNVDRRAANPNVLIDPAGDPIAIDHGGALFLSRALRGWRGAFGLPAGHILADADVGVFEAAGRLAARSFDWSRCLAEAPDDWIAATGAARPALAAALGAYAAAWAASP